MLWHDLVEIYQYRDLLKNLVIRDLTVRYKRSFFGYLWTMLNPLINTIVLTIVFSTAFRFQMKDFIIYFLSAFLLWNFFAQSTMLSSRAILKNGEIFKKIYVPKGIFVLSIVVAELINFAFALVPMFLVLLVMRHSLSWSLLFLPVAVGCTVFFTLGISLCLAAVAVYFYDIIDGYQVLLLPWMYLTPIVYPLEIVPKQFLPLIKLNPFYYLVECFRVPIYGGQLPEGGIIAWAAVAAAASFALGYLIFARRVDDFIFYV